MATVTLDDGSLYDIADAIRSKLGVSTTYLPSEMADAIMSIETQEIIQGYYIANNFFEDSAYTIPIFGEVGKFYVDLSNGGIYRYDGSDYIELSEGLRLGETDSTAYRGDRGKIAYDHAQASGNEYSSGLYKIGTNEEGHVTSAVQVSKSDITSLGIPAQDTTYSDATVASSGLMSASDKKKLNVIEYGATNDAPSNTTPLANGTASAGISTEWSRGDHVHPTDSSRMAADLKGAANGVAELDAGGKVPSSQLPSYVDDVLEYSSESALPTTGETGKIYVTTDTNTTYRWSGSAYVPISNPLDYATQAEAEAGAENTHVMTPLRTKQAIDANAYELPLMSPTTRGGAKLGHGLAIEDGALGIGEVTDPTDAGPIVELTAKGWAEQDTTVDPPSPSPSFPQEIKVCRGRNLLEGRIDRANVISDGSISSSASTTYSVVYAKVTLGQTYVMSQADTSNLVYGFFSAMPAVGSVTYDSSRTVTTTGNTITAPIDGYIGVRVMLTDDTPQLELGSVAHPYVPYGYVGVDVTHDGTTTTIPIPLPSRGWVAALPDGTADTLTLDGAGGYTWELNTNEVVVNGATGQIASIGTTNYDTYRCAFNAPQSRTTGQVSSQPGWLLCDRFVESTNERTYKGGIGIHMRENNSIQVMMAVPTSIASNVATMSEWLAENPVTVLYPLTAPTTERGYTDMPTVPVHASISSADLIDLTVRCCADEGAAEISAAWGKRYESRIANLESAVATLVAAGA